MNTMHISFAPMALLTLPVDDQIELQVQGISLAEELFQLTDMSRAHLTPWLPWVPHIKNADASRRFIEEKLKIYHQEGPDTFFIKYEGKLAGVIGLNHKDYKNSRAAIGYWLGKNFTGMGIMTRAANAFRDYLIAVRNFKRLEIICSVKNLKSQAIPIRLGFQEEARMQNYLKLPDGQHDALLYAYVRPDLK